MSDQYLSGYGKPTCGFCGLDRTPEGHDGCIGTLPGVMNACCGHGDTEMAYVQYEDGRRVAEVNALYAIIWMHRLGKDKEGG